MYDQEKTIILEAEKEDEGSSSGGARKVGAATVVALCLTLVVGYQNCAGFKTKDLVGAGFLSSQSYETLPVLDLALSDDNGLEIVSNPCRDNLDVKLGIRSDRIYIDYLPQILSGYDISEVALYCSAAISGPYEDCDLFKLEQHSTVTDYREQIESGYYDYVKYRYNDLSDGVHELYVYAAAPDLENEMLTQVSRLAFQICD